MRADLLKGFFLGDLLVEPANGQVTGAAGTAHLPPKAVEVLLCLASKPGELVTRETLLREVWGDAHGSQEALGHAVSELRHALHDHSVDPTYIQTLPKRGYRLLVEPTTEIAEALPGLTSGPNWWQALLRHGVIQAAAAYLVAGWLLIQVADTTFAELGLPPWSEQFVTFVVIGGFPILLLLAWFLDFIKGRVVEDRGQHSGGIFQGLERNYLAIFIAYGLSAIGAGVYHATVGFDAGIGQAATTAETLPLPIPVADNSLAVLRLATFDDDPTTKAFSDGLSEDILDGLARVPGLFVSARGDSWSLPPNTASDVVRRRLRVASYIEGSVRFLDDQLRVVIQLIDSSTGYHLFSRDFEMDLGSVGDMQREITELVVANLKLAVDTSAVATYTSGSDNRDAYVLYMLGREALYRPRSIENLNEALRYFGEALDIDPDYPGAHAGVCGAHVSLFELQEDTADIALAEDACMRAMSVAPRLPIVVNSVARLYYRTGRFEESEAMYTSSLEFNAQDAVAMRGLALIRRREQRFDEAEQLMQRSIELQPGNWSAIAALGNLYFRMGRFADASAEYRKVVYLDPQNFVALGNLASTSLMHGDFAVAREALSRSLEIEEDPTLVANLAIADYYLGDFENAVRTYQRSVELAPMSVASWIGLADAQQAAGMTEEAMASYVRSRELALTQLADAGSDVDTLMYLAWATAMAGRPDEARRLARQAVDTDPAYTYPHYYQALVELHTGEPDAALDAIEQALATGYPVAMLEAEPILEELEGNVRFAAIIDQFRDEGDEQ